VPGSQVAPSKALPGQPIGKAPERPPPGASEGGQRPHLSAEDWKAERDKLRQQIAPRVKVRVPQDANDTALATLDNDPQTHMRFRKRADTIEIEQIDTRRLEAGSGAAFASEALRRSETPPEAKIRLRNIIEEQTTRELAEGKAPADTKLGLFGRAVAEDFGKKVKGVSVERQISDSGSPTTRRDMVFFLE
jgi:hypothetical protein